MKLPLLLLGSVIMLGCAPAPKPVVHHPSHDNCVRIYWHMLGMEIRDNLIPGLHYEDAVLEQTLNGLNGLNGLNEEFIDNGLAQRTVFQCMQLNTQQVECMQGSYTFEALSNCEHRYESK